MKNKFMFYFQSLGKTFMLPVSLMAFLGIFLGIGASFTSPSTIETLPFLKNEILQLIFSYMVSISSYAFTYLPLLFAVAIPLGISKREKGIAAFSGLVGYMIMHISINFYLQHNGLIADVESMRTSGQTLVLGIHSLELGVLGGIFSGIIVSIIHEKNYTRVLPDAFSFFSGTRFVPIATVIIMSLVGLIVPIIWTPINNSIISLGTLIQQSGSFGAFLYSFGIRLLIPTGLHHILSSLVRYTAAGGETLVNGEMISGALNIYYAKLNAGIAMSSAEYGQYTMFLAQANMPSMMFGLPGACLAMYKTAYLKNRPLVKGLLISAALTSFTVGITEPVEFLFLFIAPALYLIHAFLQGLGALVISISGVVIGNTDGGIIDFIIFGVLQGFSTKWYIVPLIGIIWFMLYYYIFKFYILKFNIQTPGRDLDPELTQQELEFKSKDGKYDISEILKALGGEKNIVDLDNCITRLRMQVVDASIIDQPKLKTLGAMGVIVVNNQTVQVVIGAQVHIVKQGLDAYLNFD